MREVRRTLPKMTKTEKLAVAYGAVSLLFFLITATPQDYLYRNISVPFLSLNINIGIVHFIISIFMLMFIAVEIKGNGLRFDAVALLLFMRFVHYLLMTLFSESALGSMGSLVIPASTLVAYLICSNCSLRSNIPIVTMYACFIIILGAQLLYTVPRISSMPGYYQAAYALYVKVPIGSSNVIAGYLVPSLLLVVIGLSVKPLYRAAFFIMGCYLIYLTTSDAAWLFLIIGLFIWGLVRFGPRLRKKVLVLTALLIAFVGLTLFFAASSIDFEALTHERASYWVELFKRSFESPLFGHGFGYADHNQAHSILIDTFYEGGMLGLTLYIAAVALVLKKAYSVPDVKCMAVFITILFLFQCEETCYFDYRGDIIFWMTCGFAVSLANLSPRAKTSFREIPSSCHQLASESVSRGNDE